jgi:RNA polymerase sigma-70 factor (ECF subfamily)
MSRFEQLKQQEIADRLGISIKTVKNHITNALQQLKHVLDEWNNLPLWIIFGLLTRSIGPFCCLI